MVSLVTKIITKAKNKSLWTDLKARLPYRTVVRPIDRWHLESPQDCLVFFETRLPTLLSSSKKAILIVGEENAASAKLQATIQSMGAVARVLTLAELQRTGAEMDVSDVCCIATADFDSKAVTRTARYLLSTEKFRDIPFEYILSTENFARFKKHDSSAFSSFYFISPLLDDDIDYIGIYEESLTKFELKCEIRDYMDLCQLIREIVVNDIPGDVAEFGSFKGHSGYLISRLLEAHHSDKLVYMFDMFESFPPESLGVDQFWNDTHPVSFEEVSAKLSGRANVRLVKGEFETTVPSRAPKQICFAYIDCDSYRATKFLVETLYDALMPSGAILAFEDYGHPALLCNRLAVDELFKGKKDCFRFFSQSSGIYTVRKS